MSMRIVPAGDHATTYTHHLRTPGAPSAPGLYDTLRNGVGATPLSTVTAESDPCTSRHPLESRLKAWEATQDAVRMESLRKTFGVAEPIRRGMELKTVRDGAWRPLALGGGVGGSTSVHEDILRGRESHLDWEDVFTGEEQTAGGVIGIHDEMERKLKI